MFFKKSSKNPARGVSANIIESNLPVLIIHWWIKTLIYILNFVSGGVVHSQPQQAHQHQAHSQPQQPQQRQGKESQQTPQTPEVIEVSNRFDTLAEMEDADN